jgi:drug/metabolite transporter (DMT)-like permease
MGSGSPNEGPRETDARAPDLSEGRESNGREAGKREDDADEAQGALGYLLLLSCVIVWGISAVAFKVCTKPPSGAAFDPFFFTGLRFLIVAPCVALMVGMRRPDALRLQPGDWKRYVVFGFFAVVLAETLQAIAVRHTSVANLTLLSHGTISLFTAFWALILLKQRIARTGWMGAAIAMTGVAIVAASAAGGGFRFDAESLKGDAIALFRSLEHSCYLLYLSLWLRQRSALTVTVYNCAFGALWLLPYVVWRSFSFPWGEVTPVVWGAFAWSVIPTTLYGFVAWNWAMGRVGAVAATNLFYLMPVTAAVAAWTLLGEPITPGQMVGGGVIIAGIVLLRWEALTAAGILRPLDGAALRERWRRVRNGRKQNEE